ncbi:MAG: hypothetical protein U1E65_02315 [Myxococcota bacterium]
MRVLSLCLVFALGCSSEAAKPPLPDHLPFEINRSDPDPPPDPALTQALTQKLTGFWRRHDYFNWVLRVTHGVDVGTGKPEFRVWWQDVDAIKAGGKVTFKHSTSGGAHNIYIPTGQLLAESAAAYLLTGDAAAGEVARSLSLGLSAACRGFVHDAADPNLHLMARNVAAFDHDYLLPGDRPARVEYSPWFSSYEAWNAQRFEYPANPSWGDVWVTNMRSKDDVPHIYLAAAMVRALRAYAKDPQILEAAQLADDCSTGFAKDIVDNGYQIRTKDKDGAPYIPTQDLASFVQYDSIVPNGECAAKLSSALLGTGQPGANVCGFNAVTDYESFAVGAHYYNYEIVHGFHVSALFFALLTEQNESAKALLTGMASRVDRYLDPSGSEAGRTSSAWDRDVAVLLLKGAALGLPLKAKEAELIRAQLGAAIDTYDAWNRWDLWSPALPDDTYVPNDGYLPSDLGHLIEIERMAMALFYCWSPFKSAGGVVPVDCAIVKDPSRW